MESALQSQPEIITLEQYEALPEEKRVEVFDGIVYVKVNIYDDLYINFSDICKRLNI